MIRVSHLTSVVTEFDIAAISISITTFDLITVGNNDPFAHRHIDFRVESEGIRVCVAGVAGGTGALTKPRAAVANGGGGAAASIGLYGGRPAGREPRSCRGVGNVSTNIISAFWSSHWVSTHESHVSFPLSASL